MNSQEMLPGMTAFKRPIGANERSLKQTIDTFLKAGALDAQRDAAFISLAISAAAAVDTIPEDEKSSGKASLFKTYLNIIDTLNALTGSVDAVKTLQPHEQALKIING